LRLDLMYYYSLRLLPLRCFDFDNYVDINSRRPSWCCPLCGQSVCFTDIRIDKGMVKDCHDTISHSQSQSQVSTSTIIQSPTHAVGMTSNIINAMSHGQSHSQFSGSNTLQLPAHVIGTSSTIMNDMSHGQSKSKRQSQMSASNMQLPTQLVLSVVMDAVLEGPSQTYVSNHMQFQEHNLNSMRNDQSGRSASNSTYDVRSAVSEHGLTDSEDSGSGND
nr:E4 SUMO-protein ligase PIAL2-like isoform X2 [Tanacetum cinerariifolium]